MLTFFLVDKECWELKEKESRKMGILLGIVFPSIIVTGWGPRRESAGKKFPPGGMDEELQV